MDEMEVTKIQIEKKKVYLEEMRQFNDNQVDTRKRVDKYTRYILTMDGIALTISIGLFTSQAAPELSLTDIYYLKCAWAFLVGSIVSMLLSMFFMILGAYILGREWIQMLNEERNEAQTPLWSDIGAWLTGIAGTALFVSGLIALSIVAMSSVMN